MKTYEDGLRAALAACRAVEAKANTTSTLEEIAAEDAAGKCANEIEKLISQPKPVEQATTLEPEPGGFVARAVAATNDGIRMFGEYTFSDKGADSVMDINGFADELRDTPPVMAGGLLESLAKHGKTYKKVADAILSQLDSQPEEWWDACCENAPSVEY